jgi:alkylation response protein AidB-like acyl-CoA dehydrogenase
VSSTHLPPIDRTSFWERDPVLPRLMRRLLSAEDFAWAEPGFAGLGAAAADEIDRLAPLADQHGPTLEVRDSRGERKDEIVYHPAYRRLEDLAYREHRLVGVKYDPELRGKQIAHTIGFGRTLLYAMGEPGVLCPVCMTDGVARVVERSGDAALAAEVIPKLCFGPGEARNTGAMHLTEKAGGSDVGQTETVARQTADGWVLSGEKWFCSNADAELILSLARPEGAQPGTRGLGLFLVERAEQTSETFEIVRLKAKLGTRTMPTGEVILRDAPARLVGELGTGFKQMTGMLNLSRLYNAVVSCGAIGRGLFEAQSFMRGRSTFGGTVAEHPMAREILECLEAEYAGATHMVFAGVRAMDRADGGHAESAALLRALTPLVKLFTAKVAVAAVSEALECLGGCGYVEDWVTSRLLRDTQVLPIWEGTTNILVLDMLRVAGKGGLEPLFAYARAALGASSQPSLGEARGQAAAKLDDAESAFKAMVGGEPPVAGRRAAFALGRGLQTALLLEAAEGDPDGVEGRAARRLAALSGGPAIGC